MSFIIDLLPSLTKSRDPVAISAKQNRQIRTDFGGQNLGVLFFWQSALLGFSFIGRYRRSIANKLLISPLLVNVTYLLHPIALSYNASRRGPAWSSYS